jgi:hypothetical protein
VYRVTADRSTARRIISIGQEDGRVIEPTGFDVAEDGRIVVADVPRGRQRIQVFDADGLRLAGFFLPGQPAARIVIGGTMLNGTGSIQFTRGGLLVSHPESGALITTYSPGGYGTSTIGHLRPTGFEPDRELHLAMNAGLPLADPAGGYYYVFMAGRPAFQKYDASGNLVFERLLQGVELDALLAAQPTQWPRRRVQAARCPSSRHSSGAAAVSPTGELWISLSIPYTYVYDAQGDKIRTVQFRAAGIVGADQLRFHPPRNRARHAGLLRVQRARYRDASTSAAARSDAISSSPSVGAWRSIGVSIDLHRGETFALVGPNGAGKTTTLRMLAGLIARHDRPPRTRRSHRLARSALRLRRMVGLLTESPGLWDRLSVRPESDDQRPGCTGWLTRPRRGRAARAVRPARLARGTTRLSCRKGLRQRVALARRSCTIRHRAAGRADVGSGSRKRARRAESGAPAADRGRRAWVGVHAIIGRGGASGTRVGRAAHAALADRHTTGLARTLFGTRVARVPTVTRAVRALLRSRRITDVRADGSVAVVSPATV